MKRVVLVFSIIFLTIIHGVAQDKGFKIPDSLKNRSFDEIKDLCFKYYRDSVKFKICSASLLTIAKQKNDPIELATGYQLMSSNFRKNFSVRIAYLDSSIVISKDLNDRIYPAVSYSIKGGEYKQLGDLNNALDNYLAALKYSDKTGNIGFYYLTKHNIGSLKEEIGEFDEAAKMYKEVLIYEDNNDISNTGHLTTMLRLADTYRKRQYLDSATFYNKKGINRALRDSLDIYHVFVFNEGINLFYKQHFQSSLDSINKAMFFIEKHKNSSEGLMISGYLHLARIYKEFNKKEKSIEYLTKIHEHYESSGFASMEMREGYEMLIAHYKSLNDENKQLFYINKLFKIDSVLDINYKNLSKKITLEYDTPRLLEEKQKLIDDLEQKEKKTKIKFWAVLVIAVILIFFMVLIYSKNIKYKKRFKKLMNTEASSVSIKEEVSGINMAKPEAIGISEEIVKMILEGLQQFEDEEGFLSSNITTGDLAKQLKTNTKYLSKVINTYKEKSFSVYINELRIGYVIDKLKSDTKFRLYTIKAISREIGFNTTEAFSKSFYKKTGIYPSYFIKQLEK
ncbi:AraC family transcriptional regulator [Aquimarina algiphila]|uniref:AraC family transcriptional regulator n=1 Tax=Aquimarina algiphila TaxID=2047982 RepID=UPI00248F8D2C|nr:AraC family transcriptional regulator [Aquimarina algiphila]